MPRASARPARSRAARATASLLVLLAPEQSEQPLACSFCLLQSSQSSISHTLFPSIFHTAQPAPNTYLIEIRGQKSEIHEIIVFYSLTDMTVISTWSFLTDVSRTRCSWLYILLIPRIVFNLWMSAYSIFWLITTRKTWTTESLRVKNFLEYRKETSLIYFDLHIKLLSRISTSKVDGKRQNCCLLIRHRS